MFRLNIVVASSLTLLLYGLRPPDVLQLPVVALQVYFVVVTARECGITGLLSPLTKIQRALIGALILYVVLVSAISSVPTVYYFAPSWIIHILFFVAVLASIRNRPLDKSEVVWSALGLTAMLHVCVFLIAWIVWPDEIIQDNLPAFRNIRHLGYLVAPAAAIMALRFITRLEKPLFSLVCFSAGAFYIFYTGSRGGAVAMLAGLTIAFGYLTWHRQRVLASRAIILLLVTVALLLASELLPPLPWASILSRVENLGTRPLSGRLEVWTFALHAIEQNWLWGYGPASMAQLPGYPMSTVLHHPHNVSLQLLLHWGVLGTAMTLAAFSSFAPSVWITIRKQPDRAILPGTVLVTMFVHALVDGSLFYPFSIVIAIIAFSLLASAGGGTEYMSERLQERAQPRNED